MDIQPFFTEEEKKQFFSKYKQLLRHLYSFLKKEDLSKMKELMKRVVALDCYGRDKNGINGLLRNIDTALIATTEIGLKRTSVIALLLYRPVMKKIITLDEVKTTFDADVTLIISRLLKTSDLYARNTAVDSENFHKLLFSFAEDVRVILIMIADRLCLMRLGKQLKNDEDRKRLATEVSYLYAPLAHRLGLYTIKSELEEPVAEIYRPQAIRFYQAEAERDETFRRATPTSPSSSPLSKASWRRLGCGSHQGTHEVHPLHQQQAEETEHPVRRHIRLVCHPHHPRHAV